MSKTPTPLIDALVRIPVGAAGKREPLPAEVLPPDLVPGRDAVVATHAAAVEADAEMRDIRKVAKSADADHRAALAAAATSGIDPADVEDMRPGKAAALVAASEKCKALEQAANAAWNSHIRELVAAREAVLAPIEEAMFDLQVKVQDAEELLLFAAEHARQAAGAASWIRGLRTVGGSRGVSTEQGPRALGIGGTITYSDKRGQPRSLDPQMMLDALSVWCRAADISQAAAARDEALAARQAGDRQAQSRPVPSRRLSIR